MRKPCGAGEQNGRFTGAGTGAAWIRGWESGKRATGPGPQVRPNVDNARRLEGGPAGRGRGNGGGRFAAVVCKVTAARLQMRKNKKCWGKLLTNRISLDIFGYIRILRAGNGAARWIQKRV